MQWVFEARTLGQSVVRRYVIRGRPLKSRSQDTRADPGSLGRWTTQVRYLLERRVPRGSSPRCSRPTDRDLSFLVLGIWREKTFATDVEYICEKIFIFVKRQPAPRLSCSKQQQPCDRHRLLWASDRDLSQKVALQPLVSPPCSYIPSPFFFPFLWDFTDGTYRRFTFHIDFSLLSIAISFACHWYIPVDTCRCIPVDTSWYVPVDTSQLENEHKVPALFDCKGEGHHSHVDKWPFELWSLIYDVTLPGNEWLKF